MIHTKNPYEEDKKPENRYICCGCGCDNPWNWDEGYRQALFDAAKELSDNGHLMAAQRLIDAARELDPRVIPNRNR